MRRKSRSTGRMTMNGPFSGPSSPILLRLDSTCTSQVGSSGISVGTLQTFRPHLEPVEFQAKQGHPDLLQVHLEVMIAPDHQGLLLFQIIIIHDRHLVHQQQRRKDMMLDNW